MKQNTPELWDALWSSQSSREQDAYELAKEEHGIRWQRLERAASAHFGSLAGLKVIEIGAGAGTNAALMARRGAQVTVLDYSPNALKRSAAFFANNGVTATLRECDALQLPADLRGAYDIAMSFGLAEHFTGERRRKIVEAHFELVRPGGLVFVAVPNKWCLPYQLVKCLAQRTRYWKVGEEYPFSRAELADIARQLGAKDIRFFADSFWASFDFVNPMKIARIVLGMKKPARVSRLRHQRGTCWDAYLSYSIVLQATK
ncbi:MAG: class I SAM-dependent methyltransferase [Verrucomicrobia bacterium]|nr:class I SAM-dependent methyltransferase [Verrucomicrobiota bacterium]